jgi:hypothetical protein
MRHVSSSMNPPPLPVGIKKKNGFYDILDADDLLGLESAVARLKVAVMYNGDNGGLMTGGGLRKNSWGDITSSLMSIESHKVPTFFRVANDHLTDHPNHKVCVCLNYTSNVDRLRSLLSAHDPLVLDGRVAQGGRSAVIDLFQAPDTRHRLLIGNTSVCSTGIDLDDKDGRFVRFCLVSPDYDTIKLYQLSHRFLRMNTRSDSELHMVFGKQCTEQGVLNALSRKSQVMKETVPDQALHGVVFPCDFERFDETPDLSDPDADLYDDLSYKDADLSDSMEP